MEKVKLEFKIPSNKTIEYNGVKFELTPWLTMAQQVILIKNYLKDYFGTIGTGSVIEDLDTHYLEAEYNLTGRIMTMLTNIDTETLDMDIFTDESLCQGIKSEIVNYYDFEHNLATVVSDMKEQVVLEASLGSSLEKLITKGLSMLDSFKDLTPEEIEKLQKTGIELAEKLENSSIISDMSRKIEK